jgi:hypothetical protein
MSIGASERYFNSLVQICTLRDVVVGAGILVDAETVVTCAHVAAVALNLSKDASEAMLPAKPVVGVRRVYVDGARSKPKVGRVTTFKGRERGSRLADIAVLKLDESFLDFDRHPLSTFGIFPDPFATELSAFGFPLDARETIDQTTPAIYKFEAKMPNGWFSTTAVRVQGQEIREGFSGGPVMHQDSGLLFGMVCEADPGRRTATVIPTDVLGDVHRLAVEQVAAVPFSRADRTLPVTAVSSFPLRRILDGVFPRLHFMLTVRYGFFPDPPERAELQSYITEVKANFENEIAAKTFLPGPVAEIGDTPQLLRKRSVFFTPIQQLMREIAGVSSGGDSASAQISALSKRSRRVRNLIDRLLTSSEPLIVLGEPGAGKSISLKQAAIVLSDDNRKRVFPSICVFVPLGGWHAPVRPSIGDVARLVESSVPTSIRPLLPSLAARGRVIVIFDGMDEMSRERYNEKTEALSKYAEQQLDNIHTLFSCRIADYSPAFRHRRLVLLPFDRSHIRQFLKRQFGNDGIEVSGKLLSLNAVAKHLNEKELPIEPQNPFSLWLIGLYLREKSEWPETRVKLLQFLYDYQFERKRKEAYDRGESFPDYATMLAAWGQLARVITVRNRGSDIGVHEVRQIFGPTAEQMIGVGRTCGILQQSLERDPPLLRFEHQRAQEYFTALDLASSSESVDWKALWDIPRWQETLVNLSQMDGSRAPLELLGDSLTWISSEDGLAALKGTERAEREALAAERVEFASRVFRSIQHTEDRDRLQEQLRASAQWLGEKGNPISIVKVLRVAGQLPQLDLWDTVHKATESPIQWVREQAQIVGVMLASNQSRSPLPESIASAFGNGSILTSQGHFLKMAKLLKSPAAGVVAILTAFLFLAQTLVLSSLAPLAAKALSPHVFWDGLTPASYPASVDQFFTTWLFPIVAVVSCLAMIVGLILSAKNSWIMAMIAGFAAIILVPLIYVGWLWAPQMSFFSTIVVVVGIIYGSFVLYGVTSVLLFLIGSLAWLTFTSFFGLMLAAWSSDRRMFSMAYRVIWNQGVGSELWDHLKEAFPTLVYALLWAAVVPIFRVANNSKLVSRFRRDSIHFPLSSPLLDLWLTLCLSALCFAALYGVLAKIGCFGSSKKDGAFVPSIVVFGLFPISYGYFLFSRLLDYLIGFSVRFLQFALGRFSAGWLIHLIIALVLSAVIGSVLYLAWRLLRPGWRWIVSRIARRELSMAPEMFRANIMRFSPERQAELLNDVSPKMLGMNALAYHAFLIELEKHIDEAPALDKYWAKRAEAQDLVKQERTSLGSP